MSVASEAPPGVCGRRPDAPLAALWALAVATALIGPALLVSGRFGAAQTWNPAEMASGGFCETAAVGASVVYPVNAMAAISYVVCGLTVLAVAAADATGLMRAPIKGLPPVRLLSRLPLWSAIWGAWCIALGVSSFAFFVTAYSYVGEVVQFCWWALAMHIVAYAWSRLSLDRPSVHEVGCMGCVCVVHVMEGWWLDRYTSGGAAVLLVAVDVGLWFLATSEAWWVMNLAALVLFGLFSIPVSLHYYLCWRHYDEAWERLGIASALVVSAVLMRQCDSMADVCNPSSFAQAYAAWQVASAAAILAVFSFFHGGREAPRYVVIVQREGDVPATPRDSLREISASGRGGSGRAGSFASAAGLQAALSPPSPRGSQLSVRAGSMHSLDSSHSLGMPPSPRGSIHSTQSGRPSVSSATARPGQSRRSMEGAIMSLADEQTSTLRLLSQLQTSSRSLESARANMGMAIDTRVGLSPEESARARRASIEAALEQHRRNSRVESTEGLSLPERLSLVRNERLNQTQALQRGDI